MAIDAAGHETALRPGSYYGADKGREHAKRAVREALLETGGTVSRAAELLGISNGTLRNRIKEWRLSKDVARARELGERKVRGRAPVRIEPEVLERYRAQGKSMRKIADLLGTNHITVRNEMIRHGIPTARKVKDNGDR
jgi:DNA-binding protein Fis